MSTHNAPAVWPYVVAATDGHVRVARGHPLHGAGAGQVVVVDAAGVAGGDGGEGFQGEEPVEQTAGQQRARRPVSLAYSVSVLSKEHPWLRKRRSQSLQRSLVVFQALTQSKTKFLLAPKG